jgi:hypothetical protein
LAGLHFELRFEISQSGPTAGATDSLFCLRFV